MDGERGTEADMRRNPKKGEGRGNKRRQSQPGRNVGGAKHETGLTLNTWLTLKSGSPFGKSQLIPRKLKQYPFLKKDRPLKSRSKTKEYPGLYTSNILVKKSKLNRHNKLLIYTLILKPLLTYASPIWAHAARSNINLIESSQNVILRQILDAHWYMRNADIRSALKILTIRQSIRKLAVNFFSNIDGHENPSIQEISHYPHTTYPFIRRPRDILVDPDFN
ncbi:RNA-directed DNA polymerase from mobile element jockey [Trichonephila clavipes]|nr:RNA-directed DNA polymerase from mobile element jockey [Trichonephila clavipes]